MKHTLSERMIAWVSIFAKRDDIVFDDPLTIAGPAELGEPYPNDAREFAAAASRVWFSYHVTEDVGDDECSGMLFVCLDNESLPVHMVMGGAVVDPSTIYNFDSDVTGTGLNGFYVLGERREIVWDLESLVRFDNLSDYLTAGARCAFSYNPSWQKLHSKGEGAIAAPARTAEAPIAQFSVGADTPSPVVRTMLIARGASESMADDLIEWLGRDVVLLLPKSALEHAELDGRPA